MQIFSDAINIFSLQKDASPIFQGLELLPAEIDGLVGQTPAQIIDSVKNMVAEIEFAGTETETFNRRSKVLEITIAKQGQEIDTDRSRIDTLQQERAALQEAIDLLVVNKTSNQQDIAMLTEKYQVYSQIFVDSQETEDRHQSLVTQVNHANNYLKEALLANNRLELSLRLENFKINLLCQEMEKLT